MPITKSCEEPESYVQVWAGFQLTRWADDFVIVCKSRPEAERALALAKRFLKDELGVALQAS